MTVIVYGLESPQSIYQIIINQGLQQLQASLVWSFMRKFLQLQIKK